MKSSPVAFLSTRDWSHFKNLDPFLSPLTEACKAVRTLRWKATQSQNLSQSSFENKLPPFPRRDPQITGVFVFTLAEHVFPCKSEYYVWPRVEKSLAETWGFYSQGSKLAASITNGHVLLRALKWLSWFCRLQFKYLWLPSQTYHLDCCSLNFCRKNFYFLQRQIALLLSLCIQHEFTHSYPRGWQHTLVPIVSTGPVFPSRSIIMIIGKYFYLTHLKAPIMHCTIMGCMSAEEQNSVFLS